MLNQEQQNKTRAEIRELDRTTEGKLKIIDRLREHLWFTQYSSDPITESDFCLRVHEVNQHCREALWLITEKPTVLIQIDFDFSSLVQAIRILLIDSDFKCEIDAYSDDDVQQHERLYTCEEFDRANRLVKDAMTALRDEVPVAPPAPAAGQAVAPAPAPVEMPMPTLAPMPEPATNSDPKPTPASPAKPAYLWSDDEILAALDQELEALEPQLEKLAAAYPEFDGTRHTACDAEKAVIAENWRKRIDEFTKKHPNGWVPNGRDSQIYHELCRRMNQALRNCVARHFQRTEEGRAALKLLSKSTAPAPATTEKTEKPSALSRCEDQNTLSEGRAAMSLPSESEIRRSVREALKTSIGIHGHLSRICELLADIIFPSGEFWGTYDECCTTYRKCQEALWRISEENSILDPYGIDCIVLTKSIRTVLLDAEEYISAEEEHREYRGLVSNNKLAGARRRIGDAMIILRHQRSRLNGTTDTVSAPQSPEQTALPKTAAEPPETSPAAEGKRFMNDQENSPEFKKRIYDFLRAINDRRHTAPRGSELPGDMRLANYCLAKQYIHAQGHIPDEEEYSMGIETETFDVLCDEDHYRKCSYSLAPAASRWLRDYIDLFADSRDSSGMDDIQGASEAGQVLTQMVDDLLCCLRASLATKLTAAKRLELAQKLDRVNYQALRLARGRKYTFQSYLADIDAKHRDNFHRYPRDFIQRLHFPTSITEFIRDAGIESEDDEAHTMILGFSQVHRAYFCPAHSSIEHFARVSCNSVLDVNFVILDFEAYLHELKCEYPSTAQTVTVAVDVAPTNPTKPEYTPAEKTTPPEPPKAPPAWPEAIGDVRSADTNDTAHPKEHEMEEPLVEQAFVEKFSQYIEAADFEMPVRRAKKREEVRALKPRAVQEALLLCLETVFSIRDYHPSSDPREVEARFREYENALTTALAICEVAPFVLPASILVATLSQALATLRTLGWDDVALRTIAAALSEVREGIADAPAAAEAPKTDGAPRKKETPGTSKPKRKPFKFVAVWLDSGSQTYPKNEVVKRLSKYISKRSAYRILEGCEDPTDKRTVKQDLTRLALQRAKVLG